MVKIQVTIKKMAMLPPDPVYIFRGEMDPISCITVKLTSHVEYIFAGTQAGKVHVWNLKTKREVGNFEIQDDTCICINIPESEEFIITLGKLGIVSFWKEESSRWLLEKQIKTDFFGFCKSCICKDILYVSLKDSKFQPISIKTKESLPVFSVSDDGDIGDVMAFKVEIFKYRTIMLVSFEGHKIIAWDLDKNKKFSELQVEGCPMSLDFDTNTCRGICGSSSDKVLVFSLNDNLELKVRKIITLNNAGVASTRIRPDSKIVALGCWDGKLRLYSWKTLVLLAVLDTHTSTVQDISFTKDYIEAGKLKYLLAAASQDCRISLWDLYT